MAILRMVKWSEMKLRTVKKKSVMKKSLEPSAQILYKHLRIIIKVMTPKGEMQNTLGKTTEFKRISFLFLDYNFKSARTQDNTIGIGIVHHDFFYKKKCTMWTFFGWLLSMNSFKQPQNVHQSVSFPLIFINSLDFSSESGVSQILSPQDMCTFIFIVEWKLRGNNNNSDSSSRTFFLK